VERQRRLWGLIFLVSGLFGLVAIGWVALAPASGWFVAAISWPATVYAGYRIWRADHPAGNVWRELGRRGLAVASFIALLVALLAIDAFPQLVAAIIGVWLVAIVLLFAALAIATRGTKQ
jgi:hypothetical protein